MTDIERRLIETNGADEKEFAPPEKSYKEIIAELQAMLDALLKGEM